MNKSCRISTAVSMALLACGLASPVSASELTWQLENPFRLFRDPADFDKLKIPHGTTISEWFSDIAPHIKGEYLPYRRTHWDPPSGENKSGQYSPGYIIPASHRVIVNWANGPRDGRCEWTVGESRAFNGPCGRMMLDIPYDYRRWEEVKKGTFNLSEQGDPSTLGTLIQVRSLSGVNGQSASTRVLVQDILVLGLGDSYSAGEGSPDRPAEITARDSRIRRADVSYEDPNSRGANHMGTEPADYIFVPELVTGQPARWWDDECHRSLLSWQPLSALKLASEWAHEARQNGLAKQYAVTFASYACSGAEFLDGMLTPQKNPVGRVKVPPRGDNGIPTVQRSQLHAASYDLCDGYGTLQFKKRYGMHTAHFHQCQNPRSPDLVLLSIGGNDAGFAKVIMHNLLPTADLGNSSLGSLGLAALHAAVGTVSPEKSAVRIQGLKDTYAELGALLPQRLHARQDRVVFMKYPNPLLRRPDMREAGTSIACGTEMRSGMEAAKFVVPYLMKNWWHGWITQQKADQTINLVIDGLEQAISKHTPSQWVRVDGHLEKFKEHGLCADAKKPEDDQVNRQASQHLLVNRDVFGLPRQKVGSDGEVAAPAPVVWDAYDRAQRRWLRTPNDSVLTQTGVTIADGIKGAFHPTGAGYAAMADAAADEMKKRFLATSR